MKLVSIITVNYNQPAVTEALFQSIKANNDYAAIELIVVDNASQYNPVPEWKLKYPEYTFIRSDKNLGFAGGNNLGIKQAKGDYLFFINNDTEVTPGLIRNLVEELECNEKVGIISPKIHYFDQPGMLQYAGYTPMNFFTCRNACIGQFQEDKGQYDAQLIDTGYAHGAAMMVRRSAIEKAGLMAENYFLYYEELDWCERIKRQGYSISVHPKALIYHKESMSVGKKSFLKEYFMNRNRILFMRRNASAWKQFIFYCYFMGLVVPRNILQYVKEKDYQFVPALLKAIWWNITHKADSNDLGYRFN